MDLLFLEKQDKYFLIPENAKISQGNTLFNNLGGKFYSLDLKSLLPYRVTEAEAKAYQKAQLTEAVSDFFDLFKINPEKNDPEEEIAFNALIKDTLNTITDTLKDVKDTVSAAWKITTTEDEGVLADEQAKMQAIKERMTERGIELDENFAAFPNQMRSAYQEENGDSEFKQGVDLLKGAFAELKAQFSKEMEKEKEA